MRQLAVQPLKAPNLLALLLLATTILQARRISSRRLVIHVPIKMKTHHHTHTVYKVLHGAGSGIKQTVYKVVGFSGEGGAVGGHGDMGHGGHSPGHSRDSYSHSHGLGLGHSLGHGLGLGLGHSLGHNHNHGLGLGEISYEDRHGCESGKLMPSHRDMLFNHYARHDQDEAEAEAEAEAVAEAETETEAADYAEERDEFIDVRDAWL